MQRTALTPFDFRNLTLEGRGVNGIDPRSFTSSYSTFGSVGIAADAQLVDRFTVASLVFLLWDVIITLEDEVRLVWSQKWNGMKILYIVVRYFSTLAQIPLLLKGTILPVPFRYTRGDCFKWQLYQICFSLIIVAALDAILIGRVCAMYNGNRAIKSLVYFLLAGEVVSIIAGSALYIEDMEWDSTCGMVKTPPGMAIYALGSMIIMQTNLFGLTFYKFVRHTRSARMGRQSLVVQLMRDGAWAFFVLFLVDVAQVLLYAASSSLSKAFFTWRLSLGSVCGYRVFLNLRRFHEDSSKRRMANIRHLTPLANFPSSGQAAPARMPVAQSYSDYAGSSV